MRGGHTAGDSVEMRSVWVSEPKTSASLARFHSDDAVDLGEAQFLSYSQSSHKNFYEPCTPALGGVNRISRSFVIVWYMRLWRYIQVYSGR